MAMLECPVCLEPMLLPCRLPCGHVLNAHCLLRIMARGDNHQCPCCRKGFEASTIPLDRVRSALARDTLSCQQRKDLLEAVHETEDKQVQRRRSHPRVHPHVIISCCMAVFMTMLFLTLRRNPQVRPVHHRIDTPPESYVECLILLSREEVEFSAQAQPLFKNCGRIWASTTNGKNFQWLIGRPLNTTLNDTALIPHHHKKHSDDEVIPTISLTDDMLRGPVVTKRRHPRLRKGSTAVTNVLQHPSPPSSS